MKIEGVIISVLIVFVLAAVFSVIKIDASNKLQQEQTIEFYKAKADSAIRIAGEANALTTQCIDRLQHNEKVQQWVK